MRKHTTSTKQRERNPFYGAPLVLPKRHVDFTAILPTTCTTRHAAFRARMDTSNPYPWRPALEKRAKRIFKLVARGATNEQWTEWLRVPLEHTDAAGNTELFNDLREAGANSSAGWSGCRGCSLLEAATQGGSVEVVSAVPEAGTQPDVDMALHIASSMGHETAGKRLIVAGANVNFEHPVYHGTPLHRAANSGHEQLANDLLQAGARTSPQPDEYRRAPLHIAANKEVLWVWQGLGILPTCPDGLGYAGHSLTHLCVHPISEHTINKTVMYTHSMNSNVRFLMPCQTPPCRSLAQ